MELKVPFVDLAPSLNRDREATFNALNRVIDNGHLILGNELSQFEEEFAAYCGAKYCVGVGNGLDAISLSLRALNIGPGDEVIVPSQTFVATWLAVSHVGAKPVQADIDIATFLLDSGKVEAKISENTKAIIPVHLLGQPVAMDEINKIAERYGLAVLEDAAQAHGASYKGMKAGSLGDVAAFSFYPTKNLGAYGDGGAIITDRDDLAAQIRRLRNYGADIKYVHEVIGFNSRLDEFQAAILRGKLKHLDQDNVARRRAARYYSQELNGINGLTLPVEEPYVEHVYHLYVVRHQQRDDLIKLMYANGIGAAVHYPSTPSQQPAYAPVYGRDLDSSINGRLAAETALSLPLWPEISVDQQDIVISALKQALARLS